MGLGMRERGGVGCVPVRASITNVCSSTCLATPNLYHVVVDLQESTVQNLNDCMLIPISMSCCCYETYDGIISTVKLRIDYNRKIVQTRELTIKFASGLLATVQCMATNEQVLRTTSDQVPRYSWSFRTWYTKFSYYQLSMRVHHETALPCTEVRQTICA